MIDVTNLIADSINDITDFRPLPQKLDYSYCLTSYFWSVVFMSAKTLGHRFARLYFVHIFMETLLNYHVLIINAYAILPIFAILIDKNNDLNNLPLKKRRLFMIALGFIVGLLSEHIWIHWLHSANAEPSYYYPAIVGLSFRMFGPIFRDNRILLCISTVGFATILSITIAIKMKLLTITYIIGTIICLVQSTVNFQLLVGDLRRNHPDNFAMTSGQLKSLILSIYTHAVLTLLNAKYDPLGFNTADVS